MHPIIHEIAAEFGIEPPAVLANAHTVSSKGARYKAAYRLVMETSLSIREIATELNYGDWSGVNHAFAMHAASIGDPAHTTTEGRGGVPLRAIDWKKLSAHLCANYRAKDYRKAGVSRMAWRKLMMGKCISADDFLFAFRRLGLSIEQYATAEYLAIRQSS